MLLFIIINWFGGSGIWIWNRFRVIFKWKILRVNSTSPLSMVRWLILPMIAGTTGMIFGGEFIDLKWATEGWIFQSLGGSVGSSPKRALNWFIFLLRLGGRKLGPRMIQASAFCSVLPHHFPLIFCQTLIAAINGRRVHVSLLVEYEGPKWWERWHEADNVVEYTISSR